MLKVNIINGLSIKRLDEFKNIRLMALKDEPEAFGNSYLFELQQNDIYWKKILKDNTIFFAENEGLLVGMGIIKFAKKEKFSHIARISEVYVKHEFRRMGIAGKTVRECIKFAFNKENIKKIKLTVNKKQTAAVLLYKSFGFRIVGDLIKEFKIGDKYYDAYLMELVK